ncbi:MAG: hypothetical protein LBR60_01160 [Fibrobacter sp.]|nr:hypothetical protein [Fibrobacter sp.]
MKLFFAALLLLGLSALFGDTGNGFRTIQFGTDRQTVIEEIFKLGYDVQGQSSDRICIPVFMMGDLPVEVNFLFNRNDKFYSLEFRTGRIDVKRINKLFEAVDYLSDQFALKYGNPNRRYSINESNIQSGIHNIYREWTSDKNYNIYTALVENDLRYYTIGVVTHQALAQEAPEEKEQSRKIQKSAAF